MIIPTSVDASNILAIPYVGEGSHYYVMTSVTKELAARGHNVTILVHSGYKDKVIPPGSTPGSIPYNFVFFDSVFTPDAFKDYCKGITDAGLEGRNLQFMFELLMSDFMDTQIEDCRQILGNKQLMTQLQSSNFDLALVDPEFQCPVIQYLHKTIGLPFIGVLAVSTLPGAALVEHRAPVNPAYMPDFATGYDHRMAFTERLTNTALSLLYMVLISSFASPYDEVKKEYGIPDASNMYGGHELFLLNTDLGFDFPKPLLPNQIAVGGLTTKPAKPLDHVSIMEY